MPSWTTESGFDTFGKLECKRCLEWFEIFDEIPVHECVGGVLCRSESAGGFHHVAVIVPRNSIDVKKAKDFK